MDNVQIIQRVLAGERGLYKDLVVHYQRPLFKYLKAFNVRKEVIEEMAQDVFAQAFFKLNTYDASRSQFLTWLLTIAKNKTLTYLKSNTRKLEESIDDEREFSDLKTPLVDFENQQDKEKILLALDQLSTDFKNALVLFYINELSLNEIAVMEKCSVGTVKSRLSRAKEMIKKHLEKDYTYEKSV